ncbi:MAG: hypothetical protein LUI85_11385 [Bacteroides sp.]|nr:hypothetical protein [Bacteroides sp.]
MNKEFKMSFFLPPISPVKDETGRTVKPATLVPNKEITLKEVWTLITSNQRLHQLTEAVRAAAQSGNEKQYRAMKQETLPYVTPCGVFSYRQGSRLTTPSGLTVVDIDHLDSHQEAEELRHKLFHDPFLHPALVFVSPSDRGVKAFVPYDLTRLADVKQNAAENIYWLMNYVQLTYGNPGEADKKNKGVDHSGKDLVRACFLSHDAGALLRGEEE